MSAGAVGSEDKELRVRTPSYVSDGTKREISLRVNVGRHLAPAAKDDKAKSVQVAPIDELCVRNGASGGQEFLVRRRYTPELALFIGSRAAQCEHAEQCGREQRLHAPN